MTMSKICVGVDGSKASGAALRFAVDEALLRNATLRVVTTWAIEPAYGGYGIGITAEDTSEHEHEAMSIQDRAIGEALKGLSETPTIERAVVRCIRPAPWEVLVQYSEDCDLLVVGTEHKGILKRVAVGSTSSYCSRHSRVPVAVVPYVDPALVPDAGEPSSSSEAVPA